MCDGVEVDPVKTGALQDLPTPCTVKDVRRVFGIGALLQMLYSKLCLCGNPTDGFRQKRCQTHMEKRLRSLPCTQESFGSAAILSISYKKIDLSAFPRIAVTLGWGLLCCSRSKRMMVELSKELLLMPKKTPTLARDAKIPHSKQLLAVVTAMVLFSSTTSQGDISWL